MNTATASDFRAAMASAGGPVLGDTEFQFLRDFVYDPESLGREEIDEKALSGLRGVVKISHTTVNGTSLLNFDGFAPASQWEELSCSSSYGKASPEVAS